jgi:tripartite-type tricarboxylate transporter receptor subunit TctC
LTDFDAANWFAVFLPRGTSPAIIQKLHARRRDHRHSAVQAHARDQR